MIYRQTLALTKVEVIASVIQPPRQTRLSVEGLQYEIPYSHAEEMLSEYESEPEEGRVQLVRKCHITVSSLQTVNGYITHVINGNCGL